MLIKQLESKQRGGKKKVGSTAIYLRRARDSAKWPGIGESKNLRYEDIPGDIWKIGSRKRESATGAY